MNKLIFRWFLLLDYTSYHIEVLNKLHIVTNKQALKPVICVHLFAIESFHLK